MWSSIHPLPGVWRSGWFNMKVNRPLGRNTRATSAIAPSTSSMCSNTKHAMTPSKLASAKGSPEAPAWANMGPPARAAATSIWFVVGSTPTTEDPAATSARAI